MVKGASTEDSEIKLGNTTIQPTKFDDILVGAVNTDMTVAWVKHFPAFGASNGKHTTQNKKMELQNGNLYLMGHRSADRRIIHYADWFPYQMQRN